MHCESELSRLVEAFDRGEHCVIDQDVNTVISHWRALNNQQKWDWLLSDVEQDVLLLKQIPKDVLIPQRYKSGYETETYLHSILIDSIPDKEITIEIRHSEKKINPKSLIIARVREECVIGGVFRATKYMFAMKMAMKDAWKTNRYIQVLKAYVMASGGGKIKPPFHENMRGLIMYTDETSHYDTLAAKKTEILLEQAWSEFDEITQAASEIMFEVTLHILKDPYYNWKDVKDVRTLGMPMMLACAKRGRIPRWVGSELDGFKVDGYTSVAALGNDQSYYDLIVKEAKEVFDLHRKHLPKLVQGYQDLAIADVTDASLARCAVLRGPEQAIGYVRGLKNAMAREQFEKKEMDILPLLNHKYELVDIGVKAWRRVVPCGNRACGYCTLSKIWEEAMDKAIERRLLPKYDEWIANMTNYLTSKGHGVQLSQEEKSVIGKYHEKEVTIKVKSKQLLHALDPHKYTDRLILINQALNNNRVGFRFDRARIGRSICNTPLYFYEHEQPIGRPIMAVQADNEIFSMKKHDERLFSNHAPIVYATSGPVRKIITQVDVSQMDGHSKELNVRQPMREGIERSLEKNVSSVISQCGYSWGPWEGTDILDDQGHIVQKICGLELLAHELYTMTQNAVFTSKDILGEETFFLNQVLSGELLTLCIHNYTGEAAFEVFNWHLEGAFAYDEKDYLKGIDSGSTEKEFTGDDTRFIHAFKDGHIPTTAELKIIRDLVVKTYNEMGLPVNPSKTMITCFKCEYLKKMFIYGINIPLPLRLGVVSTEDQKYQADAIEVLGSLQSQLAERAARGGDPHRLKLLRDWIAVMRMEIIWEVFKRKGKEDDHPDKMKGDKVKTKIKKSDVKKTSKTPVSENPEKSERTTIRFILPYSLVYVPKAFGGIGWLPETLLVDSKDMIVLFKLKEPLRSHVLTVAAQTKHAKWKQRDIVTPEMILPQITKTIQFLQSKLDKHRLYASKQANHALWQYYRNPVRKEDTYQESPREDINNKVSDLAEIRAIRRVQRESIMDAYSKPQEPIDLDTTDFAWLQYVRVEYFEKITEAVSDSQTCTSVANTRGAVRHWLRVVGAAQSGTKSYIPYKALARLFDTAFSSATRTETILQKIINSPYFRDPVWITWTLVAMGADVERARIGAADLASLAINPLEIKAMQGWSMSDPVMSLLSTDSGKQRDLVEVSSAGHITSQLADRFYEFGFIMALLAPDGPRRVMVHVNDDFIPFFRQRYVLLTEQRLNASLDTFKTVIL